MLFANLGSDGVLFGKGLGDVGLSKQVLACICPQRALLTQTTAVKSLDFCHFNAVGFTMYKAIRHLRKDSYSGLEGTGRVNQIVQ